MKGLKKNSIITAVIMIAVGLWLFIHPGNALAAAIRIFGAAILLLGAVGLVSQLVRKEGRSAGDIAVAAVEIVAGIFILAAPGFIVSIFPFIAGVIIALFGLADFITALKTKKKVSAVLPVITVVLGIVILAHPFETISGLVRIIGIVLVYRGVTGTFIHAKK